MNRNGLLFVLNSLQVGGSETKIVRVVNSLSSSGLRTGIAYLNGPDTLRDTIDPAVPVTHLGRRGKYSVPAMGRLMRIMETGFRTIVAVNLQPLVYAIPAASLARSRGFSTVGSVNMAFNEYLPGSVRRFYAPFLRTCDRVVFGCRGEMTNWVNGCRLRQDKSDFIYNGVDPDFFCIDHFTGDAVQLRASLGIPSDALVVGSAGRLTQDKSLDMLIAAIARLNAGGRECFLILAGEGSDRGRLEEQVRDLRMTDKVRFLGLLSDVRPTLAAIDVFVLPSRTETFSNAALEAMAMARPVVLSRTGGAAEMVTEGKDGQLFDVGDLDALLASLTKLYDCPEIRRRLGAAARLRVRTQFSFSEMVARYRQLETV